MVGGSWRYFFILPLFLCPFKSVQIIFQGQGYFFFVWILSADEKSALQSEVG